jgi:hypothetical protein
MRKGSNEGTKRKEKEQDYWCKYWNDTLSKINLNFLHQVYTKMAAIY